ncbi:sigma-E factor negative regulatory protein [Marinospirillum insulare]|nr:sigma-E factor negative regulatory protein [Marinospirillum insulare]
MTDKLYQSLSSIMDGAGDDLELPRLLNAMQASSSTSQALSDKWRRYHLAQGVLRGELRGKQNPKTAQMDISAAVMQQLENESLNFTDAGAASELGFASSQAEEPISVVEPSKTATLPKNQDRGQWLRGGALAASVALLVITGTQIYNLSQEGESPANAFATQEAAPPITSPLMQASQVASDCQNSSFSGVTAIDFPVEILQRKPCSDKVQAYSPLVSSPQSRQQSFTPVSSR